MEYNKMNVEFVSCPYCYLFKSIPWAEENGFTAVKCVGCGIVYVNPRPITSSIQEAVKTGIHKDVQHRRTVINKRVSSKVIRYKKILSCMFQDVWKARKAISWLDVGAGYGEVVEAILMLAPSGSRIEGIEPMKPKALHAQKRGLYVRECYVNELNDNYDYVSIINVFSHIPDFRIFLKDVKSILATHGELFIETGTAGDVTNSNSCVAELDLPDHLVFAGYKHLVGYLTEAGFSIVEIRKERYDDLLNFSKNIIKKMMGRKVSLRLPYTSPDRSILIRSKLT